MNYVKKPIPVKAIQWKGNNFNEVHDFVTDCPIVVTGNNEIIISSPIGDMRVPEESWIIYNSLEGYYPCRREVFEETYEPVEE